MNEKKIINDLRIEKYVREGFWKNKTLLDYFQEVLKQSPDKTAIVQGEHRLSFAEVEFLSNNLANSLLDIGIRKGDTVSFQIPNWHHAAVINMALTKIGAVVNPIIPIYKHREVTFILSQSQAKAIIIPDSYRNFDYVGMIDEVAGSLGKLEHVIVIGQDVPDGKVAFDRLLEGDGAPPPSVSLDPNEVKLLIYTSGTTSEPKGVQHTHNTLVWTALSDCGFVGLDKETVTFMPSPVTHITGYCQALEFPFIKGLTAVLLDKWEPERALDIIEEEGCNYTIGSTPFLQGLLDSPSLAERDIASPFVFLCGGAEIPSALIEKAWQVAGWKVYRVYGSTEAPTVSLGMGPLEKAMKTDGNVVNFSVRIVDTNTGNPVPFDEEGRILVKGPKLFVGYYKSELNEPVTYPGGWFDTGDMGILDAEGFLRVTGRTKDIIIRGGENLSALEIEDVLYQHPDIETVAVVAMPDEQMGEKVCAFVKPRSGAMFSFEEMRRFLENQKLAKQKWPERLETLDEFPLNAAGKIQKHHLRQRIAEKLGYPASRK